MRRPDLPKVKGFMLEHLKNHSSECLSETKDKRNFPVVLIDRLQQAGI